MSDQIDLEGLSIQAWDLSQLKPSPDNNKIHTEETTARLAKSMAKLGQIQPVLVDRDGEIIAGHGRHKAAEYLGWAKIKVIQLPVDRATAIEARIADNFMSNQNYDMEGLRRDLENLGAEGSDIDLSAMTIDLKMEGLIGTHMNLDFDEDSISSDVMVDAEQMTAEGEQIISEASGGRVKLRQVFGFDTVSSDQAIALKDFMAVVMDERAEDDPAEALTAWVEEIMQ